jgi:hypothetical protein
MRRLVFAFLAAVTVALATGCATTEEENVSTIPWNRPQGWEGTGALGGFRPPGQQGY